MIDFGATPWRGFDGEDKMTEADWQLRAHQQAMAMANGLPWTEANPDEDGAPTAGCYNGDYPQSVQDKLNRQLDEDEDYAC